MPKMGGPLDALVPGFPFIFSCSALVLPNVLMWMEEILQHCTYLLPQEVLQHFAAVKLYKISSIHGRTQSAIHFPCIMTSTLGSIQPTRKPNCQTPPKPKPYPGTETRRNPMTSTEKGLYPSQVYKSFICVHSLLGTSKATEC